MQKKIKTIEALGAQIESSVKALKRSVKTEIEAAKAETPDAGRVAACKVFLGDAMNLAVPIAEATLVVIAAITPVVHRYAVMMTRWEAAAKAAVKELMGGDSPEAPAPEAPADEKAPE